MLDKLYEIKEFIVNKKYLLILLIIILLLLGYLFYFNSKHITKKEEPILLVKENKKEEKKEEIKKVKVDIKGYVNNPGLYEVVEGSRVMDVITLAGGLVKESDTTVINLGKKVFDEMVIYVYSKNDVKNFIQVKEEEQIKEEKCINESKVENNACVTKDQRLENTITITNIPTTKEDKPNTESNNKISINNATKEELMTLTGIGESKAIAIIKYREDNNGFKTLEELMNISGIGEKVFAKIKDSITL